MKKLSLVDKGFLTSEKRETPMHVASVALYTLPDGAAEQEFLQGLAANVRSADTLLPPFGDRLRLGRRRALITSETPSHIETMFRATAMAVSTSSTPRISPGSRGYPSWAAIVVKGSRIR